MSTRELFIDRLHEELDAMRARAETAESNVDDLRAELRRLRALRAIELPELQRLRRAACPMHGPDDACFHCAPEEQP